MTDLIPFLKSRLQDPLPGEDAHVKMMPRGSDPRRFDKTKMDNARLSSVLILFYHKNGQWHIPLTQRHDYGGTHSGQVSLPGGKIEPDDVDLIHTAIRETHEEIGVPPAQVEVIGSLSDIYIPPSNFKVTPVVGYAAQHPDFKLDSYEVKELMEVTLDDLLDDALIKTKSFDVRGGYRIQAPYFELNQKVVWGATAMILSELVEVMRGKST